MFCIWYNYFTFRFLLFHFQTQKYYLTVVEIDPPNSVSIFLQIPMYVLITAGEVMFSVTGLEFAYSQVHTYIVSYHSGFMLFCFCFCLCTEVPRQCWN